MFFYLTCKCFSAQNGTYTKSHNTCRHLFERSFPVQSLSISAPVEKEKRGEIESGGTEKKRLRK